jgi:hypothetical protein
LKLAAVLLPAFLQTWCPSKVPALFLATALLACGSVRAGVNAPPSNISTSSPFPYDANRQGKFVMAMTEDRAGGLWVATEGQGVWRFDPAAKAWTQFTQASTHGGLGDDECYALACDRLGRVWVGTLRDGVSVYNGKDWKTFGPVDGPLGSHVVALTASPADGDIWGATEAGLFRYSLAKNTWTYYTRADGLPSDQMNCLAFAANGSLFAGTDCDGLAIGTADSNFKTWRHVEGRTSLPNTPSGDGLPSNLINAVFITREGAIYVGTTCGLAVSRDHGVSWAFTRGADWKAKAAGLYRPIPTRDTSVRGDLLSEDWVTCLAEDREGRILVGHRQTGVERFDTSTGKRILLKGNGVTGNEYVQALYPAVGGAVIAGQYGQGVALAEARIAEESPLASRDSPRAFAALPLPAKPPTLPELVSMTAKVAAFHDPLPVGTAVVYLGEDWVTQGDWVGRYGRQYSVLCAARSPLDHYFANDGRFSVMPQTGPQFPDDYLRAWVSEVKSTDPRALYDPLPGYRRQSEWDDHGEAYNASLEGPEIWFRVAVPPGINRVSLYFVNNDGHNGQERYRDYVVEWNKDEKSLPLVLAAPPLARARIRYFWGGVYKSFVVQGPSIYYVHIRRNNSFNTIINAVMADHIAGPPNQFAGKYMFWMGVVNYDPPDISQSALPDVHILDRILAHGPVTEQIDSRVVAARTLWNGLDACIGNVGGENADKEARLLCFRAIKAGNSSPLVRDNWRWNLHLWTAIDRQTFSDTMRKAHESQLQGHPEMKTLEF